MKLNYVRFLTPGMSKHAYTVGRDGVTHIIADDVASRVTIYHNAAGESDAARGRAGADTIVVSALWQGVPVDGEVEAPHLDSPLHQALKDGKLAGPMPLGEEVELYLQRHIEAEASADKTEAPAPKPAPSVASPVQVVDLFQALKDSLEDAPPPAPPQSPKPKPKPKRKRGPRGPK